MQHEEVEEIKFPDYINEKVSDGLVFDAEAYYYYLDETTQGLPVFSKRSVNDYSGDERSQIIVCAGIDGIRYLYMKCFFI